jgi:uncharacterized protein YgiM (DUF1202 family)
MAGNVEQQVQFVAPRLVVNSSFLNVRTGPGIQFSVLITVVGGTEMPVLGRASDNVWYQVSTVVGVGWVNVQYTVPRGNFENVPLVTFEEAIASASLPGTPLTLGLPDGQGGGGPSTAPFTSPAIGGPIRVTLENGRVTSFSPGERFRAVINVEAVNLRTQPAVDSSTLGTLFRDTSNDYSIVGNAKSRDGIDWIAIDVPDVGVGWIESNKTMIRLSRVAGTVVQVAADIISLTDAPGGSGLNLPILSSGIEAFLINISRDGNFIQIELGDGTQGWLPFNSVVTRSGTPTDEIDFSQFPSLVTSPSGAITGVAGTPGTDELGVGGGGIPAAFGLDTPHVVINTGFLNIRSGPGAQFSIVATLPGGTELPVLGIATDGVWFLVQGSFGRGWVNSEFAVFRGSIDAVAIIPNDTAVGILANPMAVIATGPITLYAAPGANFGAIGALTGPLEVPVVARTVDGLWVQLNTSLGFGWVLASQVVIRGDASLIPIVG